MSERETAEVRAEQEEVLVKKRAHAIFATWMAVGIFVVWMMVSSALDMFSAWEAHNAREQLVDCIVPEGKCTQEGNKRTAEAIEAILKDGIDRETVTRQIIIMSDWCQDQPGVDTLTEREKCVNEQLALRAKKE